MRFLLVGYFGEGNLGDDILLAAAAERIRALDPRSEIDATWGGKSSWPAPDVRPIGRSIDDVRRALAFADVCIIGPGGILHNARGYGNVHRDTGIHSYDQVAAATVAEGVPLVALGVGLGPIVGSAARRATRRILDRCQSVTVRDNRSAILAKSIGVLEVAHIPDLAWGTTHRADTARPAPHEGQIAVSLRPWRNRRTTQQTIDRIGAAIGLMASTGIVDRVIGVPMSVSDDAATDDRGVLQDLLRKLDPAISARTIDVRSRRDVEHALAGSRVALTMRLHAFILATDLGVPAVGIAYDDKVSSAALASARPMVPISASPETISRAIRAALASPQTGAAPPLAGSSAEGLSTLMGPSLGEHPSVSAGGSPLERILIALGL